MANPIRRLVQLVLDRASAKRTETEAKAALGGIDKSASVLGSTFAKLGVLIGAAFSINALKNFGRAAVEEAKNADLAWSSFRNTLKNLGEDTEQRREQIQGLAKAFQAATTFGDDDFVESLDRLVGLTGDLDASINNMGLTANVAARFFDNDLAAATDVVGKAMMGNVRALKQLGIEAETAQGALQELADRSMGAAEARAATFAGKMEKLHQNWLNFLEAIGTFVTNSDDTKSAIDRVSDAVQDLTDKLDSNRDVISEWLTGLNQLAGTIVGVIQIALSPLELAFSAILRAIQIGTVGVNLLIQSWALFVHRFGSPEAIASIDAMTARIDANARAAGLAADEWDRAGRAMAKRGAANFMGGLFGPDSPAGRASDLRKPTAADRVDPNGPPSMSKNAGAGDGESAPGFKFGKRTPGLVGQDVTSLPLRSVMDSTAAARDALDQLSRDLNDPVAQALMEHNARMIESAQMTEIWGSGFDALGAEAQSLTQALDDLAANGIGAADDAAAGYIERLGQVQEELRRAGKESELMGQIAAQSASFVSQAFSAGIGPAAAQKAKQNALMAVEEGIMGFVSLISPNPLHKAEAAGHFAAAKMFGALAASWGALAGASGGFSGGGGGSSGPSRTGDVGGRRSESMQLMGAEVSIYLVGEGFDAVNPRVQEVVTGAIQQAGERYGQNARIRVVGGR